MSTFSLDTVRAHGVERLAKETGLGVRTIYRWAVKGIPGEGTVRNVRESVIEAALQKITAAPKRKAKRRAA